MAAAASSSPQVLTMQSQQPLLEGGDIIEQHQADTSFNLCSDVCRPLCCLCCLPCSCQEVQEKNEAVVLVFGRYHSTIRTPGCHYLNKCGVDVRMCSIATRSLDVPRAKMVDRNGSPLIVSAVVVWNVVDSYKAMISVSAVENFVKDQAETSIKHIISRHVYEDPQGGPCLKNEQGVVANELVSELQRAVAVAGVRISSFALNELSYAPEIAASMLKRQQAHAMVEARSTIVKGAVETAHGAIVALQERGISFSQDAKERLVGNLLTVLCSDKDAQPTITV